MRGLHILPILIAVLLGCPSEEQDSPPAPEPPTSPAESPESPAEPVGPYELTTDAPANVAAPPDDAERSESGLASMVLETGSGTTHPDSHDEVTIHTVLWTTDGEMIDATLTRNRPSSLRADGLVPGLTEGLQLMVTGEKRRFWIPEAIAYAGRPGMPAGTLVYDVELISIEERPEPPPTPENVAAPPEGAERTDSGLAFVVLQPGSGSRHPGPDDEVAIRYAGWTSDGRPINDSQAARSGGEGVAELPVTGVMAGWTEGLQLMVEGEKRRFWIPASLASRNRTAVYDIELVRIVESP